MTSAPVTEAADVQSVEVLWTSGEIVGNSRAPIQRGDRPRARPGEL
jgi:hypothetical protein